MTKLASSSAELPARAGARRRAGAAALRQLGRRAEPRRLPSVTSCPTRLRAIEIARRRAACPSSTSAPARQGCWRRCRTPAPTCWASTGASTWTAVRRRGAGAAGHTGQPGSGRAVCAVARSARARRRGARAGGRPRGARLQPWPRHPARDAGRQRAPSRRARARGEGPGMSTTTREAAEALARRTQGAVCGAVEAFERPGASVARSGRAPGAAEETAGCCAMGASSTARV